MADFNVSVTQLRDVIGDCLNRVHIAGDRFYVVRHNRPLAVLVSPSDVERIDAAPEQHEPEEYYQLLKDSVKVRNYCARCEQFIRRDGDGVPVLGDPAQSSGDTTPRA